MMGISPGKFTFKTLIGMLAAQDKMAELDRIYQGTEISSFCCCFLSLWEFKLLLLQIWSTGDVLRIRECVQCCLKHLVAREMLLECKLFSAGIHCSMYLQRPNLPVTEPKWHFMLDNCDQI